MTDQIKSGGELKACAHCGGKAVLYERSGDYHVFCDQCDMQTERSSSKKYAISVWQHRTPAKAGEDGDHIADAGKKVIQADREAAAKIYDLLGFGPCQHILDGMEDDIGVVAIVAAHRRAALHGDQEG